MKLVTKASILSNALRLLANVIERRNTIPILDMVHIGGRTIRGTDLDIELSISLPAQHGEGEACVHFHSLRVLCANIPGNETITIEATDTEATLSFSTGRYSLMCLPGREFPEMTTPETREITIDGARLKKAFSLASSFVSFEETRYYLNGVCCDGKNVVATDGHRLGNFPAGCDFFCGASDGPRYIIPRKTVAVLDTLPPLTSLHLGQTRMIAAFPGGIIRSKLIDGTFPDWRRVVPKYESEPTLTFDRYELISVARRISALYSRRRSVAVTLAWGDGKAALVFKNADTGTAQERLMKAASTGDGFISFNIQFAVGAAKAFNTDRLSLYTNSPGDPMLIRAGDDEGLVVLMPMRGSTEESLARGALAIEPPAEPLQEAA
jgi:DNA polymerase III subunit beta